MAGRATYFLSLTLAILAICAGSAKVHAADEPPSPQQKITAAYTEHLFVSICADAYRDKFKVARLNEMDRGQLYKHTTDACTCQYQAIARSNAPEDIADFLLLTYGKSPAGRDAIKPKVDPYKIKPIAQMYGDTSIMKKCGFVR